MDTKIKELDIRGHHYNILFNFILLSADQEFLNFSSDYISIMLSPKKIVLLARNRQKGYTKATVADKGHFVVYTADGERFMVHLAYLSNALLKALLQISEEVYGLPGDGPITLPCKADFLEYLLPLMERRPSSEIQKTVLASITAGRCSTPSFIHCGEPSNLPKIAGNIRRGIGVCRKRANDFGMLCGLLQVYLPINPEAPTRRTTALLQPSISLHPFLFSQQLKSVPSSSHVEFQMFSYFNPMYVMGKMSDFKRQRKIFETVHFVLYTADGIRLEVPLNYLDTAIFQKLLKFSEEESGGGITLECNSFFLDCFLSLIQRHHLSKDTQKALLVSIAITWCLTSYLHLKSEKTSEITRDVS
ncbi:hypothetical protein H6P81_019059 [Aristolochia fimbriata]|uniref:Uncharacterized protein n=1 Tax=Aristolochia fimbriata TaxID=158543 RepID=A0AAV7E2P6_ARIFI|nr:hypothetical protein H6P81_019059 [Aristolochia fimbriata]